MNEEEAELLPPYLRPYPPSGAPLGTLSYNRRSKCWVVKGDPSVTEVCKRLFPGSAGSRRGEARFTAHRRAVGDLCWLMMRFPLEIKASDRALWEKAVTGAREYAVRQAKMATMPVRMTPPDGAFLGTLRPFQEEGLSYLCSHDRCLLADEMVTPQLRALVRRLEEFANNGKVGGLILRGGELTLALNTGYVFANVPNAIDMRDIDGIRKWFTASLTGMAGLLDILRKSPALTDTVSQA